MAQLTINHESFALTSSWVVYEDSYEYLSITSGPSLAEKTVIFEYKIPVGAEVLGAHLHSEWGDPLSGFAIKTVNGIWVPSDGNVDVEIDPAATTFNATFRFKANGSASYPIGNRSGITNITNIYLVIQYKINGLIYLAESNALVPYQIYHAENSQLVPYQLFKCISTEEELGRIAQLMQDEYPKSKVDLLNRPQIDAAVMNAAGWDVPEGSYSTVDTVTYTYNDFGLSGDYAINVTPILDDGTVIDGGVDGLWQYISDELNNGNQLEDLDIFLGKYNTVEEAEAAAQRLHELQEDYYTLKEETAVNKLVQY